MGFEYSLRSSTTRDLGVIIGFDVGCVTSAVSFALLLHDRPTEVRPVTWSNIQNMPANRIPSIMYYSRHGHLKAVGAAAVSSAVIDAEDRDWFKVEGFKVHLRPYDWEFDSPGCRPGLLPPRRTGIEVMGDFLCHLYDETVQFIKQHYVDGEKIWEQVQCHRHFVFSFPNGWDNVSQHRMVQAAIHARLVPSTYEGGFRIDFVSEGDASAFSCLTGHSPCISPPQNRFVLFDAGESMLQAASYEIYERKPLFLKELARPDHSFSGSISISTRLRQLLKRKLEGSPYDGEDALNGILEDGIGTVLNASSKDLKKACLLRVGARTVSHPQFGIQRGFLKLSRSELAECFEQTIADALDLIRRQITLSGGNPVPVFLVGVLGPKPWMLEKLKEDLSKDGVVIITPDIDMNSAVADGCVLGLLHGAECDREVRRADGIECSR